MAKSKARFLAELLGSTGLVKKSKSELAGADEVLDLDVIPTIPNSKLQNSSISIAGHSTALGGSVSLNTGNISEHTDYKYYTDVRARKSVSVSGDLAYNSTSGVISFTERTDAEVRGLVSATGSLSYNSTTGVMSFTMPAQNTSNITEGTNLYFTNARARSAISATGSLSYNSTTGVFSYTTPTTIASLSNHDTADLTEGTNLYFTNARADARIAAASTSDLSEGSNLYYTNARADARIAAASTSDLSEGTNLYYTDARADARVALIVDSAPGTLNTLNELAAALGDDANFSTTVTNSIATKLPLAGGALTGAVTTNSTFDGRNVSVDGAKLDGIEAGATADQTASEILTAIKTVDGSGSGLDADLLDGIQGASLVRNDTAQSLTNTINLRASGNHLGNHEFASASGTSTGYSDAGIEIREGAYGGSSAYSAPRIGFHWGGVVASNISIDTAGAILIRNNPGNAYENFRANNIYANGTNTVWHVGNDGSGSGLDADTVDGIQAVSFLRSDASDTATGNISFNGQLYFNSNSSSNYTEGVRLNLSTGGWGGAVIGGIRNSINGISNAWWLARNPSQDFVIAFGTSADSGGLHLPSGTTALKYKNNAIYHSGNDGSGSGLDADLLDGYNTSTSATANTVVVRQGSGHIYGNYIFGSYFNASSGNSENPTIGQVWTQSTGDNYLRKSTPAHFKSQLGLWHTGNDGSGSGLDADLLDGRHLQQIARYQSGSDFANGTLVTTNIASSATNGDSFVIEITGKAYGSSKPHSVIAEGYLYNNTIIATSGTNMSGNSNFTYLKAMNNGGYLSFWWPRHAYWNSYDVHVRSSGGGTSNYNRVTAITNSVDPSGATKKIQINLGKAWNSDIDGAGSGLDADLLDGQQGSYYYPASNPNGYTNDQTAAEILTAIKTVDGSGSGLDADLLDGVQGTNYFRCDGSYPNTDMNTTAEGYWHVAPTASNLPAGAYYGHRWDYDHINNGQWVFQMYSATSGSDDLWFRQKRNYSAQTWHKVWTTGNDGSGSGLDADLLDGQQGSYYAPASHNHSGVYLPISGKAADSNLLDGIDSSRVVYGDNATGSSSNQNPNNTLKSGFFDTYNNNTPTATWYSMFHSRHNNVGNNHGHQIAGSFYDNNLWNRNINNGTFGAWNKNWSSNNDGSGSGLDADLLDGIQASSFMRSDAVDSFTSVPNFASAASGTLASRTGFSDFIGYNPSYGSYIGGGVSNAGGKYLYAGGFMSDGGTVGTLWRSTNDGSGSGLDADLLDGQQGSYYYAASNPSGYQTGSGTVAQSHYVSGNAFATTGSPGSVLEYQQASGQSDTRLSPTTDWYNSIRMGHGNPYNYYSNTIAMRMTGGGSGTMFTQHISNNNPQGWRTQWDSGNDGAGSGLDADLLDGIQASSFLRSDATDTATHINSPIFSGNISTSGDGQNNYPFRLTSDYNSYMVATAGNTWGLFWAGNSGARYGTNGNGGPGNIWSNSSNPNEFCFVGGDSTAWTVQGSSGDTWQKGTARTADQGILWGASNDGSGSGLDADLLDGQQGSYYAPASTAVTLAGTQTITGNKYFLSNRNTTSNSPPLQAYSTGNTGAIMSFHRAGYYAVNMGLDSDNVFRIGGWSAATNRFVMDMSGNLTMAGNITAYSDSRLKENVEVIENALSKVQAMRGVTFTRNDVEDKEERHAGVIAQEVEVVFPEVVSENNEGIKNVAYGNMVGLLIEAVKELKQEVEDLKTQLKEK